MAIPVSYYDLFKTQSDFQQVRFIDNFYENVAVDRETSAHISRLLTTAINDTRSNYVKRSALILLCDLTLTGIVSNAFTTIALLSESLCSDESDLQAVALKYIPFFDDGRTSAISQRLKELSDSPNGDVASQAHLALGLFELSVNRVDGSAETVLLSVVSARKYFEASFSSAESREDAHFYILFTQWAESALSNNIDVCRVRFTELKRALSIRVLYEHSVDLLALEFLIFQVLQNLETSLAIAEQSGQWLDVISRIKELYEISIRIDSLNATFGPSKALVNRPFSALFKKIEDSVYATNLSSEKQRLKAIQPENWQLKTFIDHVISLSPADPHPSTDNLELLALLADSLGKADGLNIYRSIDDKRASPEVINIISTLLVNNGNGKLPFRTGSVQGAEIWKDLMCNIRSALPDYPPDKMEVFSKILEEVIRYTITTFTRSDRREFSFLFTQELGGKGQTAVELDLQDSMLMFFRHSNIADGLDHEKARFVDGGRIDIVYARDIITIPIELKRSYVRPDAISLEQDYIAQAQTYTAGYDQLGVFAVLELSDKLTDPPPNIRDWFNIHHLQPSTNLPVKFPDYIVSVVIPGNRASPSSKSTYGR